MVYRKSKEIRNLYKTTEKKLEFGTYVKKMLSNKVTPHTFKYMCLIDI